MSLLVKKKKNIHFCADKTRVLAKLYIPFDTDRMHLIADRILSLSEESVKTQLTDMITAFSSRHLAIEKVWAKNFLHVHHFFSGTAISDERRLLIGSYFTHEYAIQSTAFFNPSIVPHFNQNGMEKGSLRVILSFRSVGGGCQIM